MRNEPPQDLSPSPPASTTSIMETCLGRRKCCFLMSCLGVVLVVAVLAVGITAFSWNKEDKKSGQSDSDVQSSTLNETGPGWTIFHADKRVVEILNFSTPIGILRGEYCYMYGATKVQESLLASLVATKKEVSSAEMDELVELCDKIQNKTMQSGSLIPQVILELPGGLVRRLFIFPGTRWCGAGDIARNDDDLGPEAETDSCCRDHDKCPDNIEAGETKHNLTNSGLYTKSNCSCDTKFYNCLRNIDNFVANSVGTLYFDILATECFTYDHPLKCVDRNIPLVGKCTKYEEDTDKPKEWQFVTPKEYTTEGNKTDIQRIFNSV